MFTTFTKPNQKQKKVGERMRGLHSVPRKFQKELLKYDTAILRLTSRVAPQDGRDTSYVLPGKTSHSSARLHAAGGRTSVLRDSKHSLLIVITHGFCSGVPSSSTVPNFAASTSWSCSDTSRAISFLLVSCNSPATSTSSRM